MADNRDTLKRIIALLLGIAGLAERASMRTLPVLCLVLWIVRPAEAIGREFVKEMAQDCGVWFDAIGSFGMLEPETAEGYRADALRLATVLRTLASMLEALLALPAMQEPGSRPAGRKWLRGELLADLFDPDHHGPGRTLTCFDTS